MSVLVTYVKGSATSTGMNLSWGTDSAGAFETWDRAPEIGDGFGLGLPEGMPQEAEEAPLLGHFCPDARACTGLTDGALIICMSVT